MGKAHFGIGEALALSEEHKNKLVMAGLLHDIGGLSLKERLNDLHFEEVNSLRMAAQKVSTDDYKQIMLSNT